MDVVALVGPAGSGKSHRASLVALREACDLIIDDGLLIKEGKIVAGVSAKREESKVGAVRRAIFADTGHRDEVRTALRKSKSSRVLILGTSDDMIVRITDALDLPRPEKLLRIEDIATPAEIRLARRKRRNEGKHVIPAPTVEVKKTFSGFAVDPLRFLLKRSGDDSVAVEKSVVRPTFSSLGRFFIADTVVASIASHAAEEVAGVRRVTRVIIDTRRDGVTLDLELTLRHGHNVWEAMRAAQANVRQRIEQMTALNVLECNLEGRRIAVD